MEHHRGRAIILRSLFLVSMLAALLTVAGSMLWYATPKPPELIVGKLADFPLSGYEAASYFVDTGDYQLFVVNTGDELIVLDARATTRHIRHVVRWVQNNNRFEDPLSGSKYSVTGEWLEGPSLRDLDRYASEVMDGEVYVYLWQRTVGAPSDWPARIRRRGLYSGGFCVDQGFRRRCEFP